MEIKTTSDIYVETTHLIRVAESNLEGQSHNDFLKEVATKKWISVSDILEILKEHASCPFQNGSCKIGSYKQCVSNIYEQIEKNGKTKIQNC